MAKTITATMITQSISWLSGPVFELVSGAEILLPASKPERSGAGVIGFGGGGGEVGGGEGAGVVRMMTAGAWCIDTLTPRRTAIVLTKVVALVVRSTSVTLAPLVPKPVIVISRTRASLVGVTSTCS